MKYGAKVVLFFELCKKKRTKMHFFLVVSRWSMIHARAVDGR